ncbi:MAG: hypothetical protein KDJ52_33505 [Anaerolineae bacterium]|nr:hypothetical protein [Anaerolineae bacterium]
MASTLIKNKVLQEIDLIPEDKLTELYTFIHYFRLGVEKAFVTKPKPNLAFAGCWQDMPDEMVNDFTAEIKQRRRQAFAV